jgi:hypothetical protein
LVSLIEPVTAGWLCQGESGQTAAAFELDEKGVKPMRKTIVLSLVAFSVLFLASISRAQENTAPMVRRISVGFDPSIRMSVRQRIMDNISRSGVLPQVEERYDQQKIDKAKAEISQICAQRGLHANVFVQTTPNPRDNYVIVAFRIVPQ